MYYFAEVLLLHVQSINSTQERVQFTGAHTPFTLSLYTRVADMKYYTNEALCKEYANYTNTTMRTLLRPEQMCTQMFGRMQTTSSPFASIGPTNPET